MSQFPVYILDDDTILFPNKNMNHVAFWEKEVCLLVADKFGISAKSIKNLPYCQRRGRVVGERFYCGEELKKTVFNKIKKQTGIELSLVPDEHEARLEYDLEKFKSLIKTVRKNLRKSPFD
jgi:hypothetical protein